MKWVTRPTIKLLIFTGWHNFILFDSVENKYPQPMSIEGI